MVLKRIEERCKSAGISISALEKALGIGNATISRWDKSSPRVETLSKVADYFGCTVDELIR